MTRARTIALAGNPNVGKSTLFNLLTGMHQHTGNWPGKTVGCAEGVCSSQQFDYTLVDLPGTYSLMAHSVEEVIARDYLLLSAPDAVIIVCDATCLERNLNLAQQTIALCPNALLCVNLMDEAARKGIRINLEALSKTLGIPVIGVCAHKRTSRRAVLRALDQLMVSPAAPPPVRYPAVVERAIDQLADSLPDAPGRRWLCLAALEGDALPDAMQPPTEDAVLSARQLLLAHGMDDAALRQAVVSTLVARAASISEGCVHTHADYNHFDRTLDRILTSKQTGYPVMLLLLLLVLWLTIAGANRPSQLLTELFAWLEQKLTLACHAVSMPEWLYGALVCGVYRVAAWVVAAMLPPMAIFFPLFTLLEDAGYLPRIAYNLDRPFQRCRACGKQALTMCMGFGCNAVGVMGCRIIDSPRERLLAILTNSFVPCNGRFPTLTLLVSLFILSGIGGAAGSALSALALAAGIVLGVAATMLVTKLLSATLLKGLPSSFALELPPYRRPQIGKVLVRSVFDRTLFVLGRAVVVAAPAGLLLWVMANVPCGGGSLLAAAARVLNPVGRALGLDGMVLLAFLLGFPANEIVLPIVLMGYLQAGSLQNIESLASIHTLLLANGWTLKTAVCMLVFCLFHWPCSTTVLTIHKETGSLKWTLLSVALPTLTGALLCVILNLTL